MAIKTTSTEYLFVLSTAHLRPGVLYELTHTPRAYGIADLMPFTHGITLFIAAVAGAADEGFVVPKELRDAARLAGEEHTLLLFDADGPVRSDLPVFDHEVLAALPQVFGYGDPPPVAVSASEVDLSKKLARAMAKEGFAERFQAGLLRVLGDGLRDLHTAAVELLDALEYQGPHRKQRRRMAREKLENLVVSRDGHVQESENGR